jgi:DNA-binding transcriptional LysR family regulator
MHDGLPPLGWLRTFEAAARRRGFAEAARELAMTPTAVSQQMRALEQRLGARLFVRLARGVALTDVGAAYLPAVRDALDGLASATAGLFEPAARSGVALRCTASFAIIVVAPTLPAFRAAHPRIDLSLHTAIWSDAVMDERIDLEVRHGAGPWEGFDSEPLAPGLSAPICPPDLDLAGPPDAALARAMGRGLIHIAGCENLWADAARRFGSARAGSGARLARRHVCGRAGDGRGGRRLRAGLGRPRRLGPAHWPRRLLRRDPRAASPTPPPADAPPRPRAGAGGPDRPRLAARGGAGGSE